MTDTTTHVPCGLCGRPTTMTGTKRCDRCWELETRVKADEAMARRILGLKPRWDDEKAMLVAEAVKKQKAHWTVYNEYQATVSVDPGTNHGTLFWFGTANKTIGADVYENDERMASGTQLGSVDTELDGDKCDVEEAAKAIIIQVERVLWAVKRIHEGGGWAKVAGSDFERSKSMQLEVMLRFSEVERLMQDCEEMLSPVEPNMEYVVAMSLFARRASEIAADANQRIATLLSYKEFMEVKD